MLSRGKLILLILSFFFITCEKVTESNRLNDNKSRDVYLLENFRKYESIYNRSNDSLLKWSLDSLAITKTYFFCPYQLDSIFIFNSDSTLFFTCGNYKSIAPKAEMDGLLEFYGRRINGKWYFFFGGTSMVLPRAGMQDSVYAPFSFEEMSYLAYDQKFEWMIKAINEGNQEKIDAHFDHLGADIQECPKINGKVNWKCVDSLIVATDHYKYNGKMTKQEIAEIQKSMAESVRPPEPPKETKQWWQFWKEDPQIPIFETEEWKDYLKKKYGSKWQEHL